MDEVSLVDAYFKFQATHDPELEWAWEAVDGSGFHDPESKWTQLLALIEAAPDDWQLGLLAAGPLEDFVRIHGPRLGSMIDDEAARNDRLRTAMGRVWIDRRSGG